MKVYAVIGRFDYEGEDIQGVWTNQLDADAWIYEYFNERRKDDMPYLPWNELILYEVEGTSFTRLREFDRDMKQTYRKQ